MDEKYNFLLDLYPIMSVFPPEASLLTMRLEQAAFSMLHGNEDKEQLRTLLCLAKDLGYLDDRLYFFLEKRLGML